MIVKTKKLVSGNVDRLEGFGEIKEVFINEDLFKPEEARIQICFRGEDASGIVELSKEELENVYNDAMKRVGLSKPPKIRKFKK